MNNLRDINNSTAGVVQVEENLPGICIIAPFDCKRLPPLTRYSEPKFVLSLSLTFRLGYVIMLIRQSTAHSIQ